MNYLETTARLACINVLLLSSSSAGDFESVVQVAKEFSQLPFKESSRELPKILQRDILNYDQYRHIRFLRKKALWQDIPAPFRTEFFHLGYLFQKPVAIHEIADGKISPVPFRKESFAYGDLKITDEIPPDVGFAGLRFIHPLNRPEILDDLGVFQGASYFRFLGKNHSYGLSARGLAIDSAEAGLREEFPTFTQFWLQRPAKGQTSLEFYSLLESPSVTGAYSFNVTPGETTRIDVSCVLFIRNTPKSSLGIAPLTSMFWYGENTSVRDDDFRPEVHDSDGLLIKTSTNKWTWRPLITQKHPTISKFPQTNPKGFGLLQRDRNPAHYQDYANPYQRTPSLFIEPLGEWGAGEVRLCELPTNTETHDNIVAFWSPSPLPKPGAELRFKYRMHWTHETDLKLSQNKVIATRSGMDPFQTHLRLFTIDFAGPGLKKEQFDTGPPKVKFTSSPSMKAEHIGIVPSPHSDSWRVTLKLPFNNQSPPETQLHVTLTDDAGNPISETWNYLLKKPSP